ncbi:MAG: stage IV sporulation protein A [Clostridiales bacterium]|nr:stage IV sporulation protein A [Clostridiales bacterium]
MSTDIYKDIAKRSSGDIYLGVVGPVRTGKSTFISNFVKKLVLPNIVDKYDRERNLDELPQSANGKLVMTTQPKFIPSNAVKINVSDVEMNVRLVDCVGYMVEGAMGQMNENAPRFVKTPWSEEELPFTMAAEIGTKKVITDHSTIAVMVTTDGSFGEINRENYVKAEEDVVKELKNSNKPFVIVLNTNKVDSEDTKKLVQSLQEKYSSKVLPIDCLNLSEDDVSKILEEVLNQFPIESIQVKLPKWMQALSFEDELISEIIKEIKDLVDVNDKIGDFKLNGTLFENSENFEPIIDAKVKLDEGTINITIEPKPELFYKVLSKQCGIQILSDFELISYIKELTYAKQEFDKVKEALETVNETGYGVVYPKQEDIILEDPELTKHGGKYGVKIKAKAPSLHIMRVDVDAEVSPIVGSQNQSEDLIKFLKEEQENNPNGMWETNLFGKSLQSLISDGVTNKITTMPQDAQKKMRRTLTRIVNEGKGGIICILL